MKQPLPGVLQVSGLGMDAGLLPITGLTPTLNLLVLIYTDTWGEALRD